MIDYTKFKTYTPSGRNENMAEAMSLSGGRSSAYTLMMLINGGFGTRKNQIVSFQNTGKEHETCYVFLRRIEELTGLKILWLEHSLTQKFTNEFVLPDFDYDKFDRGEYTSIYDTLNVDKLRTFTYEKSTNNSWYKDGYCNNIESTKEVNFNTASRNGKPFTDIFLYKCAIRIMKGEGLILPSAGQRWCTGDMKEKLFHRWMVNNGYKKYMKFMGMRADEPLRVDKIFRKNDKQNNIQWDCPLHWEGVNKLDVLIAWFQQTVDLGLNEYTKENSFRDFLGNCIYCHLKAKIKKLYLIQQGFSLAFYRQIETICNNYNGDIDAMNRAHGTYESLENEAKHTLPISIEDVLNDEEIEIQCVGCGD